MPDCAQNIWIISKYASPAVYGFEHRLFVLAREWRKAGRNPVIISSDSTHLANFPEFGALFTRELIDDCETWWIKTLKYTKTVSVRRILSWLDFEAKLFAMPKRTLAPPDVVIVSSLSLLSILNGVWLRRQFGCKLIFEIRDIWPLTMTAEGGYSDSNPAVKLLAWVERFGYRHSDLVVGTMPNLTEHVAKVAGDGIPCVCIPFGFEPSFFNCEEPLPDGYLEQYIPKGKFIVGYAGSIGLTNALESVISVAKDLADDKRFFFLFIGSGDRRDQFIAETDGLQNVAFAPRVRRKQVQSLLRNCDLLYFAAYDSEVWRYGMSLNKLIDYMMAAKPILASYSGFPSMLNEAGCGQFVPASDTVALKQALEDFVATPPEKLALMGKAGRKWLIANRPWSVLARQYLDFCDRLCAEVQPGG